MKFMLRDIDELKTLDQNKISQLQYYMENHCFQCINLIFEKKNKQLKESMKTIL
jgi:uncharacterized protein YutD